MLLNIQHASPVHLTRCLLKQPYGSFVLRHPVENDEVLSKIRNDNLSNQDHRIGSYVVLSVRVDETIYGFSIKHYLWPHTKENNQVNSKQLLELYNKQQKTAQNNKFTPLKQELLLSQDNGNCFFDNKNLQDIDYHRIPNSGQNNQGISKAFWQSDKQSDIKVFIKRFQKGSWYFKHELSILRDLSHFSIVTLYGQYSDDKFSHLVFEDAGDSLESQCPLHYETDAEKMRHIARIGFQISQAMVYLEKKNIVHRDLTAGNVLINSYGFIKVADFGHALKKEEGKNSLERPRTNTGENRFQFRFLAPECLPDVKSRDASNRSAVSTQPDVYARFSSKSDVWSFGILLIQLMIKNPRKPYPNINDVEDIPRYIKRDRNIHEQPHGCSVDMYLILKQCWAYETINRISFKEIREKMSALERIN